MPNAPITHRSKLKARIPYHEPAGRRGSASSRGYDQTWRKVRASYLLRHPLCVVCGRAGRTVEAAEVDHIVPIANGGARLDERNLQALCHSCHSRKTARTDGGFGRRRP